MPMKKGGIFRMLVISYVLFAALLMVSIFITVLSAAASVSGSNPEKFSPFVMVDAPHEPEAKFMDSMGTWIEGLDENYQVVTVIGNKRDDIMLYTGIELFQLLNASHDEEKKTYQAFIRPADEQEIHWWLAKLPQRNITITFNIMVGPNSDFAGYFYLMIGMFILNCIILSWYLSRKIKKPLEIINAGMERIRAGEQNVRLDFFKSRTEFADIRDSFHYMSQKLDEEKELREQNEARKNQLLADLSHDIKTPVATIKAYANALAEGLVAEGKRESYLQAIDAKADRVSSLANDLFTVLKLDSISFHPETIDIAELLRKLCATVVDEAESKALILEADIPEEVINYSIDSSLLPRAIENLLDNAMKYNNTGQFIRVTLRRHSGQIIIDIADDGTAIPPACREAIFNTSFRVDQSRSTVGGTGLGLTICAGIVKRHGGEIEYLRQEGWNIFQIRFPASNQPFPPPVKH